MTRDTGWSWKTEDPEQNAGLHLRYEPGAWGDLLKSAWALGVADALRDAQAGPLKLLDPFAGAPVYPLVEASAARLEGLPAPRLRELLAPYVARGLFPSTARLVLDAWGEANAEVFDADPVRRAAWEDFGGEGRVRVAAASDGQEVLEARPDVGAGPPDLVHVDPYDLFERFEGLFPAALGAGPLVLFYLFNKAPRSARAHARYRDLRARLERLVGREPSASRRRILVGRIPSDARLPRAFHELILVGSEPLLRTVEPDLRSLTLDLHAFVSAAGAFEGL